MTTKTAKTVKPWLVNLMVKRYGTIEAAREAYRAVRTTLRSGEVVRVTQSGLIAKAGSSEVFYRGSVDAPYVLPS